MAKKADRRTQRTQAALREAFLQLLMKRSYDAISVQDIVDQANVGRSTFYEHCAGKDQLLRLSLQMMRTEMAHAQAEARKGPEGKRFHFSLPILEHIADHRALYPNISRGRGFGIFAGELRDIVLQLARNELGGPAKNAANELTAHFVAGAFISVLMWWIERHARLAPAEIDRHFQALVGRGVPSPAGKPP